MYSEVHKCQRVYVLVRFPWKRWNNDLDDLIKAESGSDSVTHPSPLSWAWNWRPQKRMLEQWYVKRDYWISSAHHSDHVLKYSTLYILIWFFFPTVCANEDMYINCNRPDGGGIIIIIFRAFKCALISSFSLITMIHTYLYFLNWIQLLTCVWVLRGLNEIHLSVFCEFCLISDHNHWLKDPVQVKQWGHCSCRCL